MDVMPQTPNMQGATENVKNLIVTNQIFQSTQEGLTAHAGGLQPLATPIVSMCARFTTCATIGDSAILPAAMPGLEITVINAGHFHGCDDHGRRRFSGCRIADQYRWRQCGACVARWAFGDLLHHRRRRMAQRSDRSVIAW